MSIRETRTGAGVVTVVVSLALAFLAFPASVVAAAEEAHPHAAPSGLLPAPAALAATADLLGSIEEQATCGVVVMKDPTGSTPSITAPSITGYFFEGQDGQLTRAKVNGEPVTTEWVEEKIFGATAQDGSEWGKIIQEILRKCNGGFCACAIVFAGYFANAKAFFCTTCCGNYNHAPHCSCDGVHQTASCFCEK